MTLLLCKWQPELTRRLLSDHSLVLVLDAHDVSTYAPDPEVLALADKVYVIDSFDSLEDLVNVAADLISAGRRIDRVFSFTEYSQLGASMLRSLLGLATETSISVAARDKRLMKARAASAGVRTARWRSIADGRDQAQVASAAAEIGFPMVLKPASGSGTEDTYRIDDLADLRAKARLLATVGDGGARQAIAEEFIEGTELHVDALWHRGDPMFLTVSEYFRPRLAVRPGDGTADDGSVLLPRDEHDDLYERLTTMSRRCVTAFDAEDCATHLEVFRTSNDELVFSEIATRVGGGWAPALLGAHFGADLWTVIADGMSGRRPLATSGSGYLAAFHLRPQSPGRIVAMPEADAVLGEEGVVGYRELRRVGDDVTMRSPSEWCAFVVVRRPTRHALDLTLAYLASAYRVQTEPVDLSTTDESGVLA